MLLLLCVFAAALGKISFNGSDYCVLLNQVSNTPGYLPDGVRGVLAAHAMFVDALNSIPEGLWAVWNISSGDFLEFRKQQKIAALSCEDQRGAGFDFHAFAPCLDGLVLAPHSHTLAFASNLTQVAGFSFWCLFYGVRVIGSVFRFFIFFLVFVFS